MHSRLIIEALFESVNRYTIAELKLKDGTLYAPGTDATFRWERNAPGTTLVTIQGREIRLSTSRLYKYFKVAQPPTMALLKRWMAQGVAKSVLGHRVEPDGWDPESSPSWMLVLGLI